MTFTVQGLVVLITGAGMGMGRLYAERAVREGAAVVVLWDVDGDALENAVLELASRGSSVHGYVVDVGSADAVTAAADAVLGEVGAPHVLINNAGIVHGKHFWEHHPADIDLTLQVNTGGPMHVTRAFLPAMMLRDAPARILNVASAAGTLAVPRMSVYAASKWAVIGWSDSLRPIAVTTLIPGYVRTGMFEGIREPLLTPLLEPGYVVDRAWKATLAGRARVQLPWTVQLAGVLRNVLPQPVWDVVADRLFGIYSSMEHFTGRKASAPRHNEDGS